jgi:hypothetical protein
VEVELGVKTIVEEPKIEETIRHILKDEFTVLDFTESFKKLYHEEWKRLVERFGLFGSKRRYTVTTYLSNRLDVYSQKPYSILVPFTRYSEGKFKDYRKTTEEERKFFGSPWIAHVQKEVKEKPNNNKADSVPFSATLRLNRDLGFITHLFFIHP